MILIQGKLKNGLAYEGRIAILPKGGTVKASDGSVVVEKADSCRVLVSLATDYVLDAARNWKGESPRKRNDAVLARALKVPSGKMKRDHLLAYGKFYNRVSLD